MVGKRQLAAGLNSPAELVVKLTVPVGATGNVDVSVTVAWQKTPWLIGAEAWAHVMLVLVSLKATSNAKVPTLAE